MKRFEYRVTLYPVDRFQQLVYLCTDSGQCRSEQVPADQQKALTDLLNDRGAEGWELVQLDFSRQGAAAFWKRAI